MKYKETENLSIIANVEFNMQIRAGYVLVCVMFPQAVGLCVHKRRGLCFVASLRFLKMKSSQFKLTLELPIQSEVRNGTDIFCSICTSFCS